MFRFLMFHLLIFQERDSLKRLYYIDNISIRLFLLFDLEAQLSPLLNTLSTGFFLLFWVVLD